MLSLPVNIWRIKEKQTFRERTSLKLDTHPSKVKAVVSLPGHVFNGRVMAEEALQSLWSSPLVFLTCQGGQVSFGTLQPRPDARWCLQNG